MSDDDNVVSLTGFKRPPAELMSSDEWAKELCRTYFRTNPDLPEPAIDRKLESLSTVQLNTVAEAVMLVIEGCLARFAEMEKES